MQPWRISIGFTAVIVAFTLLLGGERYTELNPYWRFIFSEYGAALFWNAGIATTYIALAIYAGARAAGLADMGRKVDLMERSLRRGEAGQEAIAEKLKHEDRGEFSGS